MNQAEFRTWLENGCELPGDAPLFEVTLTRERDTMKGAWVFLFVCTIPTEPMPWERREVVSDTELAAVPMPLDWLSEFLRVSRWRADTVCKVDRVQWSLPLEGVRELFIHSDTWQRMKERKARSFEGLRDDWVEHITKLDELGERVDALRAAGKDHEADAEQFDESGRCRACGVLMGGDRSHRCWDKEALPSVFDHEGMERAGAYAHREDDEHGCVLMDPVSIARAKGDDLKELAKLVGLEPEHMEGMEDAEIRGTMLKALHGPGCECEACSSIRFERLERYEDRKAHAAAEKLFETCESFKDDLWGEPTRLALEAELARTIHGLVATAILPEGVAARVVADDLTRSYRIEIEPRGTGIEEAWSEMREADPERATGYVKPWERR